MSGKPTPTTAGRIQALVDAGRLDEARSLLKQERNAAKKAREAATEQEAALDAAIASLDRLVGVGNGN